MSSKVSIVKPTRSTIVSNYYILEWHYIFLRSFPPSSGFQMCTYSNIHMSNRYCWLLASEYLLASRQQCLFNKCLLQYVQFWTPDDGRKDRLEHVECHSKIKCDTLVFLVGFTIEISYDARPYERQISSQVLHTAYIYLKMAKLAETCRKVTKFL